MEHPIVEKWMRGDNDAGGTISELEARLVKLESAAQDAVESLNDLIVFAKLKGVSGLSIGILETAIKSRDQLTVTLKPPPKSGGCGMW